MTKTVMDKIKQGRQFRSMTMECRTQNEEEEKRYIVEGYATTFNEAYTLYDAGEYRVDEVVELENKTGVVGNIIEQFK